LGDISSRTEKSFGELNRLSSDQNYERSNGISPSDKTENFLLTAADQSDGSRDERLTRVIKAKYEAGLLKPYNYVNGYARLSKYMENK